MLAKTRLGLFLGLCLLACSCCRSPLNVVDLYLTIGQLPSFHVGTPDPNLYCPTLGQRLIIRWNLGQRFRSYQNVRIDLSVRYCNREEVHIKIPINCPSGHTHFDLLNEEYFCKGGIQSYKLDLYGDDTLISCWRHQLWVDLVEVQDTDLEENEEEDDGF